MLTAVRNHALCRAGGDTSGGHGRVPGAGAGLTSPWCEARQARSHGQLAGTPGWQADGPV